MAKANIEIQKICEWCGREFLAQKVSTKFCSTSCTRRAYKYRLRQKQIQEYQHEKAKYADEKEKADLTAKDFLSPTETAKLLNINRATIYRYLRCGIIPCVQFKGKTIIRRCDIDKIFEQHPEYQLRVKLEREPIKEFYTTKEILEKYHVSNSWLFKFSKEQNPPKTMHRGKTLWSAKHIDAYFAKNAPDPDIDEWYSVEEMRAKFGMTVNAVYSFVSTYAIPRKKKDGKTYYSKRHVDKVKGIDEDEIPEYYTVAEAMKKYTLTRDQVFYYVKARKIYCYRKGRYTYILSKEFDAALATPQI